MQSFEPLHRTVRRVATSGNVQLMAVTCKMPIYFDEGKKSKGQVHKKRKHLLTVKPKATKIDQI